MVNGREKSIWPVVVLIATVFVYVVYILMSAYTFANLPPIPSL